MNSFEKLTLFENELKLIKDDSIRELTGTFLSTCPPDYFYEIPASSSGKYHPQMSLGKRGLVRHTKMVVAVLDELFRLEAYNYSQSVKDCMYAAALMHDTFKHGYSEGHTISEHPVVAARIWKEFIESKNIEYTADHNLIYLCILGHMGQWGPKADFRDYTQYVNVVHLADYIASRKFFDLKFEDTYED